MTNIPAETFRDSARGLIKEVEEMVGRMERGMRDDPDYYPCDEDFQVAIEKLKMARDGLDQGDTDID